MLSECSAGPRIFLSRGRQACGAAASRRSIFPSERHCGALRSIRICRDAPRTGLTMTDEKSWPTELRLQKDRKTLTVSSENGQSFDLAAEYLRVKSPSAEVQGHSPAERITVPGKKNVEILDVLPVGNYAVRLMFDDLHSTGIYGWDYLLEL